MIVSNRRKFINQLTIATAGLFVSPQLKAASSGMEETFSFLSKPYLQGVTDSEATICCVTNKRGFTWVLYGEENLDNRAVTLQHGLIEAGNTLNKITIKGLHPGTVYRYKIYSKEIKDFQPYDIRMGDNLVSEQYSFKTVSSHSPEVNVVVMNDIHDRPESIITLMSQLKGIPYDFVFLNGDIFNYGSGQQQLFDNLFKPVGDIFASSVPFILSRGNHECRGVFARRFLDYFHYPYNGGKTYYSFVHGPVHFTVLDTGEDKPDDAEVYAGLVDFDAFREEQAAWLEREVVPCRSFKEAAYRVVFMHIPPWHSGSWHGSLHCRRLFSPLFEKYGVDLVIAGHTHIYGLWEASKEHSYPIIIGGGPKNGSRTIMHIAADNKRLNLVMKRDDGYTLYNWSMAARIKK